MSATEPERTAGARQVLARALPPRASRLSATTFRRARALALAGRERWCPCCGHGFRRFLDSASGRPDVVCPSCGSHERHRLFALWLEANPERAASAGRVLHFAPEPAVARLLARAGIDRSGYVSADIAPGAAMRVEDVTALTLDDRSFDVVLCSHVLEHVADDAAAMREIHRVLRPGGWALMQVPIDAGRERTFEDPSVTDPDERVRLFGQDDHVRVYGRDYRERLEAAGFAVVCDRFGDSLEPAARTRMAVDPEEALWVCERSA